MLYKKKTEPALSDALFQNPSREYRGAPFWAWNCKLNPDVLSEQIEYLHQMGFGGYHMHPRVGFDTPYLSEEFMRLIRHCIEKGKQEDMLSYLYDEDRWPSGAAGGFVTKDKHLRAKHILFTTQEKEYVSLDAVYEADKPALLARYDILLNDAGELLQARILSDGEMPQGTVWNAYLQVSRDDSWFNNQAYLDTLNPQAVDAFVHTTCDAYDAAIHAEFGDSVPSIFTDEPQYSSVCALETPYTGEATLPWTEALDGYFSRYAGQSLTQALPEILFDLPQGKLSAARYHYFNCIAQLFADSFAGRYGAWCDAHGIALTGHLMHEPTLDTQTEYVGDAMRSYHHFGIPGIDMLCDNREFTTAKQCQSVVHQCGKEGMLSELYGVTSWDYDFKNHKSQGDWQAALGVTLRVPHLSWVSMKGEAKRDYPASILHQSPWFREYGIIEDHFARVNTALTRGEPDVHIAVIHPIESYWLLMGPQSLTHDRRTRLDTHFQDVTRWLLYDGADFDYLNEATLPGLYTPDGTGLQVGKMQYDVVLVPDCLTLRQSTLDILKAFAAKGGKVIFAGNIPAYVDARPGTGAADFAAHMQCVPFEKNEILSAVRPFKDVTILRDDGLAADELLCCMRRDGRDKWLFVAHGERLPQEHALWAQEIELRIKGKYIPTLYDTMTGDISPVPYAIEGGQTVLARHFERTDSLLLRLTPAEDAPGLAAPPQQERRAQILPLLHKAAYRREEPNVLLLDRAAFALDDEPFAPEEELLRLDSQCRIRLGWPVVGDRQAQPWVIPEEPLTHTLTLRFRFESEIAVDSALLALENAEKAEVTMNGAAVDCTPVGFFVDRDIPTLRLNGIRAGENELCIRLPFGKRTSTEWCYILGEFNVRVEGCVQTIVPATQTIGFSDVSTQGLPFYGGNILYKTTLDTPAGDLTVRLPHIGGALARVWLDGRDLGAVAFAPFAVHAGHVEAGAHTLEIRCYGNRYNTFGPLHCLGGIRYIGPGHWRTTGDQWQYEYRLNPSGLLASPEIRIES